MVISMMIDLRTQKEEAPFKTWKEGNGLLPSPGRKDWVLCPSGSWKGNTPSRRSRDQVEGCAWYAFEMCMDGCLYSSKL